MSPSVPGSRDRQDGHTRVLVVEDQALVREAVVAMFDHEPGFTVVQAGSLTEARRLFEAIDVAILDLSLPDGNGADLIPELHAANPHAIAVVLTSSIDPGDVAEALQRGAAAVLNKLDDLDQLLAIVKRLQRRPPI
jgi:DNA-binding NarL/FixJ family response regulator